MVDLPEGPDERRMFNEMAETLGGPVHVVIHTLILWSRMYPFGSFGSQCAIMANEVRRTCIETGD
jgi:hypothetical protein